MSNNKKSLSFGRYLRTIRLEKGINLEVVSRETKITLDNLLLIEQEDHNGLPAEVFVKGFLRSYARTIDADEDEVIRRYILNLQAFKESIRSEDTFIGLNKNYWTRLLLSIGTLLCIIVFSIYVVTIFEGQASIPALKDEPSGQLKEVVVNKHENTSKPSEVSYPDEKNSEEISERLLLKIKAVEITWMEVIIDKQDPEEYILHPGDHLELEASTDIKLLIGNAGGVKLTLNDKSIESIGKSGQVVRIQLP